MNLKEKSADEKWKPIAGYEGLYEISNFGRVRSLNKISSDGRRVKGKLLKTGVRDWYSGVTLSKNNVIRYKSVHRLVAEHFISNPERKPFVNHIDGDKTNCNVSNLEWCTASENCKHAFKIGLCKVWDGATENLKNNWKSGSESRLSKPVGKYCKTTKRLIKSFDSITHASHECGVLISVISKSCNNQAETRGEYFYSFI